MSDTSQRILVVAPHPDDECLGCGGTLRLLANAQAEIEVVFLTRGEVGTEGLGAREADVRHELATRRPAEAASSCEVLGVRRVHQWQNPDGRLGECGSIADQLADLLGRNSYTRLFCPWPREAHPDHSAAFRHAQQALARQPNFSGTVWLYEVWTPMVPNTYVPIDSTIEAKRQAIRAHASQLESLDYLNGFEGLARYRALFCPPSNFVEAFLVLTLDQMLGIAVAR